MEAEQQKDYAFKNEISLSISGEDSADSTSSTPSTATPLSGPTPSPRHVNDDTKPLTESTKKSEMSGIDNKAFESNDKTTPTSTPGKQMSSFGNGNNHGGDSSANKNGQLTDKKLAGETFLHSHVSLFNRSTHKNSRLSHCLMKNDHIFL
jgi:hypothetical protein